MRILLIFFFSCLSVCVSAQSIKDLVERRSKTLEEINYVDKMLVQTEKQKKEGLNDLKIISSKLYLRQVVIDGINEELGLISERIELNTLALNLLENDLLRLKKEYASNIVSAWKLKKKTPDISFMLAARDFNQGYKRIRYLQQASEFRRNESEIINQLKDQIENFRTELLADKISVSELKGREETQKEVIKREQERKRQLVNTLGSREKQLRKELEDKKRNAAKIESEIAKLLEEERKKSLVTASTPEMKLIGDNFADNKGRIPWPVERGVVTSKFGIQQHPVLTYVKEDNIGIEITSENRTIVRAVFKGQVARVFTIPGSNGAIIIRHGRYMTVYQNLVNIKVKQGDPIDVKQELGDVFLDSETNRSVLKFMVYDERNKMDPEIWLAKRR
jgi:septal ring factor EnvC (AmiA/AmiB activator)